MITQGRLDHRVDYPTLVSRFIAPMEREMRKTAQLQQEYRQCTETRQQEPVP